VSGVQRSELALLPLGGKAYSLAKDVLVPDWEKQIYEPLAVLDYSSPSIPFGNSRPKNNEVDIAVYPLIDVHRYCWRALSAGAAWCTSKAPPLGKTR
jgi:hypothetical protein